MLEIIRYNGHIYRVEKLPFETTEQIMDRAWYIAKLIENEHITFETACNKSRKWLYQKYLKVKYS